MTARGMTASSPATRTDALRHKHALLKHRIETIQGLPSTTDFYLKQLKKEKLLLKEEIEGIRSKN